MILFIKHIDIEGPGTFGDYLKAKKIEFLTTDLGAGQHLPKNIKNIDAVVALGGPMNVYEESKYPFLKEEEHFLRSILSEGVPFLGICLGSQLLAKASGAGVGRSPRKEIGFSAVKLTADGKKDPLFKGLEETFDVYQWHEDMFEIPPSGTLLALSSGCPHQAFKVGDSAYGLQFHVEITGDHIRQWTEAYIKKQKDFQSLKDVMLADYQKKQKRFVKTASTIYENFLKITNIK